MSGNYRSKVVIIFGLSGVGKSWMCSRLANAKGYLHVAASDLLMHAKKNLTDSAWSAEQLRTGDVSGNQAVLASAFNDLRGAEERDILLDGHNIIDTDNGVIEVPVDVTKSLMPDAVIYVQHAPEVILGRRLADVTRSRPIRTLLQITEQQNRAVILASQHAVQLDIPFSAVLSGDERTFALRVESATLKK